jgi:hypothetical protein
MSKDKTQKKQPQRAPKKRPKTPPTYSMSITIDQPDPVVKRTVGGITQIEVECTVTGGTVANNGVKAVTSSTGGMIPNELLTRVGSSNLYRGWVTLNGDIMTGAFFVDATAEFVCPGDSTHPPIMRSDGPTGPHDGSRAKVKEKGKR